MQAMLVQQVHHVRRGGRASHELVGTFRLQVAGTVLGGLADQRTDTVNHITQCRYFVWIVGEKHDGRKTHVLEDGADLVIGAEIRRKSEQEVGAIGVNLGVTLLQEVCADLGRQTNTTSFVSAHVEESTSARSRNALQGGTQLLTAITACTAQHVPGEAFRMNSRQYGPNRVILHVTQRENNVNVLCHTKTGECPHTEMTTFTNDRDRA
mmetsp:Transcript_11129/g.34111  ORF Transcript_11129/g.34111 Transcript_11129/m.34111 type:complete len:209 (-) Transcript_11129:959-1585(-)